MGVGQRVCLTDGLPHVEGNPIERVIHLATQVQYDRFSVGQLLQEGIGRKYDLPVFVQ